MSATLNFNGIQCDPIEKGSYWFVPVLYEDADQTPVDLSAYTAIMQVRSGIGKTIIVELSTDNGCISFDSNGNMLLELSDEQTAALPAGRFLYDLKITDVDGRTERFLEGEFVIKGEITHVS